MTIQHSSPYWRTGIPLPAYIHSALNPHWPQGAASAWWLHHSLTALEKALVPHGVEMHGHAGSPLCEPGKITRKDGIPYRVFTPFWMTLQGT